jgi:hypothetical protein
MNIIVNGESIPAKNASLDVDMSDIEEACLYEPLDWHTGPTVNIELTPYPEAVQRVIDSFVRKRKVCITITAEFMKQFKPIKSGSVVNLSIEIDGQLQEIKNYKVTRRDYKRNKVWMVEV